MRKMFPVKKGVFENAEISMGGNTELRRRSGLLIKEQNIEKMWTFLLKLKRKQTRFIKNRLSPEK